MIGKARSTVVPPNVTRRRRILRWVVVVSALVTLVAAAQPASAQQQMGDPGLPGLQASRPALELLVQQLKQAAQAPESSEAVREWSGAQATAIQTRLAEGDFQLGDRVAIRVEGDAPAQPADRTQLAGRTVEEQLSDTFPVGRERDLTLPMIGVVSLRGVLHSELGAHLTQEIGRFVRDPVVQAHSLVRLSIVGAVNRPGYVYVPTDAVLPDALMAAGGPKPEAKLDKARIERSGNRVLDGQALKLALAQGRTLDDLNLRAGDQVVVPGESSTYEGVRLVSLLLGIPVTIYALTKIF